MAKRLFSIDLFFDLMSPYSCVAFETLTRLERSGAWPISLALRPVFMAAIFKESGNNRRYTSALKFAHLSTDLARAVRHFGIPQYRLPTDVAKLMASTTNTSVNAMRLILALEELPEKPQLTEAIRQFYHRLFLEDKGIFTEEDFHEVLVKAKVRDADALIARSHEKEIKERLIENTKLALSYKAFGAPWIVVHTPDGKEECFFGSDRLPFIADTLGVPFNGKEIAKM